MTEELNEECEEWEVAALARGTSVEEKLRRREGLGAQLYTSTHPPYDTTAMTTAALAGPSSGFGCRMSTVDLEEEPKSYFAFAPKKLRNNMGDGGGRGR